MHRYLSPSISACLFLTLLACVACNAGYEAADGDASATAVPESTAADEGDSAAFSKVDQISGTTELSPVSLQGEGY